MPTAELAVPEKAPKQDPLLSGARFIVSLMKVLVTVGFIFAILLLVAVLTVRRPVILARIAEVGGSPMAYPAIVLGIALIMGALHLAHRFLIDLKRIIDSVRDGQPFAIDNADRLHRMGWFSLGMTAAATLVKILFGIFAEYAEHLGAHHRDGPGLLSGILLALVLFILARVFRAGAQMRDDLEGTV